MQLFSVAMIIFMIVAVVIMMRLLVVVFCGWFFGSMIVRYIYIRSLLFRSSWLLWMLMLLS